MQSSVFCILLCVLSSCSSRRIGGTRTRRAVCEMTPSTLTAEEKTAILDKHNSVRGMLQPSGANAFKLEWDEKLAQRAQAWADKCTFKHGFLQDCEGSGIGQNLYTIFSDYKVPDVNLGEVAQSWYDEQPFYRFNTADCEPGKVCGHYTQVVWANTRRVGCGLAKCPVLVNPGFRNLTNAANVVCNYDPPGNYKGSKPYASGPPCSQCKVKEGGVKCEANLCVPCLPKEDPDCECPFTECNNDGVVNKDTCECSCKDGFYGSDCSLSCTDSSPYCSFWTELCADPLYKGFMTASCAKTCGLC